jgi:predicted CXXCH cytochrome family protein
VGECLVCHAPHASNFLSLLRDNPSSLCLNCHADIEEKFTLPYLHGPFAIKDCKACHDPHASDFPYQLKCNGRQELCLECHQELKDRLESSSSIHKAIKKKGCLVCHNPHAAKYSPLLKIKKEGNFLCLSCHRDKAIGTLGHPVMNHPTKGVTDPLAPERDLGCYSCHDPHASIGPSLLKGKSYGETCKLCHKWVR